MEVKEAMWEILKGDVQALRKKAEDNCEVDELRSFSIIYHDMERLEQKYFPKEAKQDEADN